MTIDAKQLRQAYREAVTDFNTASGIPTKGAYTPEDIEHIDYKRDIGNPGEYPFTRGHHPSMYRGKFWNVREISGLSTPKAFNKRCKYLLEQGQGVLDWEMDMPTFYGLEPDQPYADGFLGVSGVSIHRFKDVEVLSEGLPLDELSLSISISAYMWAVWQSYFLIAQRRGYDISQLRGIGGANYYYAPATSSSIPEFLYVSGRFSTPARWGNDFCEHMLRDFPKFNVWLIEDYDLREAGANAIQEIAFGQAMCNEFTREMLRRGVDINTIGRHISAVLSSDRDFFEEIAKFRAARQVYARTMKERFGATDPEAMRLRFHVDVSGVSFTRQQPLVNIARGTVESLAAILGGCMGLQNPSYDEAWATPTEESVRIAIRTQQVLKYESGVARVADPLAGSYYVEWLTSKLEDEMMDMVQRIEDMGGWIAALENGWIQNEIRKESLKTQRKEDTDERVVVGVNKFVIPPEEDFKPNLYAPDVHLEVVPYIAEYKEWRERRDRRRVKEALEDLRRAADRKDEDLYPWSFRAVEADATFSEILGVLRMADGLKYDWAGEREYPF